MAIEVVAAVPMEIIMAIEAIIEVPMEIIMATVVVEVMAIEAEATIHTMAIMVKARMLMTTMELMEAIMEPMEAIMVLMRIMATKIIMENVMNAASLDIIETNVQVEPVPRRQK